MTQMTVLRPEQIGKKGVIIKGERNALIGYIANGYLYTWFIL